MTLIIDITIGLLLIYGIYICGQPGSIDASIRKGVKWVFILFLISLIYKNIYVLLIPQIVDYLTSRNIEQISPWISVLSIPQQIFQLGAFVFLILVIKFKLRK